MSTAVLQLTRPSQTAGYVPHVMMGSRLALALDGRPRFTWMEAERMRLDPQVQFGLRILRAPLWGVTWKIHADSAAVETWIDRQFGHIYRRLLPRIVRMYEYGVAAGEVTFKAGRANGKTRVLFDDYHELHPRDARPLVYERGKRAGQNAGLHVLGGNSGSGSIYLDRRHSLWCKGEAEYGDWYGRPRLAGAYEPWLEKRGRHGAIDMRRLFYKKGAFRGPVIRYPIGRTDMGSPGEPLLMSNQDIARELVEKFESGGVLALPNIKAADGSDLWAWEDPKAFSDAAGFLDYPKQLDKEILIGLSIPPELVEAATVGSGYSGRAIPAQVFFSSMDEIAGIVIETIDRQVMRQLVRLNFGAVNYEIEPDSLAKLVSQSGPGGGDQQTKPGQPPASGDGPKGGSIPYTGPHGGQGFQNSKTGKVSYGKHQVRLSLEDKRRKKRLRRMRLSWTYSAGPRGGHRWVSATGEVRYQEEQPTDASMAGPETVFQHPAVQKAGFTGKEPNAEAIRARYQDEAESNGIDPEQMHRSAANLLDYALHRSGGGKPIDRGLELHAAYASAHGDLVRERGKKVASTKFGETYFDHDSSQKRAAKYMKAIEAGTDALDAEHLDADTRSAVAEDLATLPPEKLAGHLAWLIENADDDSAEMTVVRAAAKLRPATQPPAFSGDAGKYSILTVGVLSDAERADIESVAHLSPGAMLNKTAKGFMLVPDGTALYKALDVFGAETLPADDDEGLQSLFDGIGEHPQVPQSAVPASAKNFGTTSGALTPDAVPDDWNPNAVDLYKRLDDKGQWYLLKRSEGNPEADESGTYVIVSRKDVPDLSRLPAPYWNDLDTAPGTRSELVEETEKRQEKQSVEGVKAKREIQETPKAREFMKLAGKYKGEHLRTGNLVRSDEAIKDRVQGWAGQYMFDLDGATDDSDRNTVEHLDNLESALTDAREHEPEHEYDPEGIDFEPDTSLLIRDSKSGFRVHDTRAEHVDAARDTSEMFSDWEDTTNVEVQASRERAQEQSQEYRDGLRERLQTIRDAAQKVLALPTDRITPEAREQAAEVNRHALKTLGRLTRKVNMSMTDPARKLWEQASGPVLAERELPSSVRMALGSNLILREVKSGVHRWVNPNKDEASEQHARHPVTGESANDAHERIAAAKIAKPLAAAPIPAKRAAPGSQLTSEQRERAKELGMTGTLPPPDVPLASIKFASADISPEDAKFKPIMQWDQKTKSGRISRQYRYTQEFHDRNAAAKFDRVKKVEPHLAAAKTAISAQVANEQLPERSRDAAAIANIIAETGLRPTDEKTSIAHGHYGIASLLAKHAVVEGDSVKLDFIGKEGVQNQTTITDPESVAYLKKKLKTKTGDTPLWLANSADAGAVLKKAVVSTKGPADVKLKDLRTIKATQTAARVVSEYTGPPPPLTGNAKKDERAIVSAILAMSGEVAKVLNNTASQARDNYIHPEVFKTWLMKLQSKPRTSTTAK